MVPIHASRGFISSKYSAPFTLVAEMQPDLKVLLASKPPQQN
jgi:hypothetical protein